MPFVCHTRQQHFINKQQTWKCIYDGRGEFKLAKEPLCSSLSPVDHFFIFRLFNALPPDWRGHLKRNKIFIFANTQRQALSEFYLRLEGKKHTLDNLHSKLLYQSFVTKISSKPTAMKKYDKLFNTDTSRLDWEKIYLLPFKTTLKSPCMSWFSRKLYCFTCNCRSTSNIFT